MYDCCPVASVDVCILSWGCCWLLFNSVLGLFLVVVQKCPGAVVGCCSIVSWGYCWLLFNSVLGL